MPQQSILDKLQTIRNRYEAENKKDPNKLNPRNNLIINLIDLIEFTRLKKDIESKSTFLYALNELTNIFEDIDHSIEEKNLSKDIKTLLKANNASQYLVTIKQETNNSNKAADDFVKQNSKKFIETGDKLFQSLYTSQNQPNYSNLYSKFNLEPFRAKSQTGIVKQVIKLFSVSNWFKSAKQLFRLESVDKIQQRQDHLAAINSLMWSIHNKAITEQGKDVERGSFTLKDPDNKLFEFLLEYVKLANNGNTEGFLTGSDLAYSRNPANRLSSHHKEDQQQYGIDMRFNRGDYTTPILPGNMPHLLFGQIDINGEKHTFIKFERVGLGSAFEAMLHGKHYLEARNHKANPDNTKEFREKAKDIPPDLTKIYTDFCTNHNIAPKKKALIHEMFDAINKHSKPNDNKAKTDFINCAKKHKLDNLESRKAKEVIMDLAKLFIPKALNKNPLKKFAKPITANKNNYDQNSRIRNWIDDTIKHMPLNQKKPPNNSNPSK
jgi:hypothetical protein